MNVIVPLAGPDFVRTDGGIKALGDYKGHPFLKYVLDSRPWSCEIKQYSFILYDCQETRRFGNDFLKRWYEGCYLVYISGFTRGAAISTLAGLSGFTDFSLPLIVDLADIIYSSDINITQSYSVSPQVAGIALCFESFNPQYSYLEVDRDGFVVRAVEKKVISKFASAGTYIFRDTSIYLKALAHAFVDEYTQTFNDLFYVCPLFNGLISQGLLVNLASVYDVIDIKNIHTPGFPLKI